MKIKVKCAFCDRTFTKPTANAARHALIAHKRMCAGRTWFSETSLAFLDDLIADQPAGEYELDGRQVSRAEWQRETRRRLMSVIET